MARTTRIKITAIDATKIGWRGEYLERFFEKVLKLRTARRIGDEESVNNYVLGQLNVCRSYCGIDFIKVKENKDEKES